MSKARKSVGKAAAVVMAAVLLSRILALVRDVMIAGLFGQGRNTDRGRFAVCPPDGNPLAIANVDCHAAGHADPQRQPERDSDIDDPIGTIRRQRRRND